MHRAATREKLEGYVETHHIVPRAFGGSNDRANLVDLTGREHFIAHRLLAKMFPDSSMVHAVFKMACIPTVAGGTRGKDYKVTSRTYEFLRNEHAKRIGPISSVANKQKIECPWCHKVGGIAIMKRWHFDFCKSNPDGQTRPKVKRMSPTAETRRKMSVSRLGKSSWSKGLKMNQEFCDKVSNSWEKTREIRVEGMKRAWARRKATG